MKKKIALIIALLWMTHTGKAQTHSLQTDGTGRIIGNLPELVFNGNNINFKINDPKESFALYEKMLADKANRAKRQLTKLLADAEKMDILSKVYGISVTDINNVIANLNIVIANQFAAAQTYIPVFTVNYKKYYSVVVPDSTESFEANAISGNLAITSPADGRKMIFTLSKTVPFKKLTYDWLQTTKSDYSGNFNPDIFVVLHEQLKARVKTIEAYLETIEPLLKRAPNYTLADVPALNAVSQSAVRFTIDADNFIRTRLSQINLSSQYKDWVLKWLWYQTNYMPALNPFNFKVEGNIGTEPDTSKLEFLRLQIQAREEFYKSIDMKKTSTQQLDTIINEAVTLRKEKSAIEKAAKDFTTTKTNNDKAILDFGNTSVQLNEGMLVVGKDTGSILYWQRHHDASNNYQMLNENITDEYREDDRVVILSHNLKPGEVAKISLSFKDITNDASQLSDGLSPLIGQLSKAANALGAFAAAGGAEPTAAHNARIEAQGNVVKLIGKITELQAFEKALEYLVLQSNPVIEIKETVDKTSSYHSELSNPPKKITGPKKATYYMNTETAGNEGNKNKTVPDTFTYRINKLYRIFPMAGAFYTTNQFVEMKEGKINELPHTRFVVGLKVYVKKTDIRNTKFFTGKDEHNKRLWKSRTSVQVAFDAQKPLRNIYLGAGLDLWPGFCVSVGAVASKYTYTEFSNGETVRSRELYRPGLYVGVSTDISLFTDVVKFLNLSK
ncbi:MAG: hypothetical protein WBO39_04185 [Ferruginibacter sp.]